MKQLWILAGGNGAGKSTFFDRYLKTKGLSFVNADRLAKEISSKQDAKVIRTALDQEIVSYYIARLKEQPRDVLKKHGIAEIPRGAENFQFIQPVKLLKQEKDELIQICDEKI